jgi:hypothetical protein
MKHKVTYKIFVLSERFPFDDSAGGNKLFFYFFVTFDVYRNYLSIGYVGNLGFVVQLRDECL